MSLSPEGRRRLIRALGLRAEDQKDFADSLDRLMDDVSNQPEGFTSFASCPEDEVGHIKVNIVMPKGLWRLNVDNWPSQTTLSTNMLERSLRGEQTYMFELSNQAPASRRSPARLKEAVSWWFARAEARRIIERMMQP